MSELQTTALAERLRALRLAAGYAKARHFAQALGISENRYTRYERGDAEPDFELMRIICAKLGTTPNALFGWETQPETQAPSARQATLTAPPGFAESGRDTVGPPLTGPADRLDRNEPSLAPEIELAAWRLAHAFGAAGVGPDRPRADDAPLDSLRLTAEIFLRLRTGPLAAVAELLRGLDIARLPPARQSALSREIEAFVKVVAASLRDGPADG